MIEASGLRKSYRTRRAPQGHHRRCGPRRGLRRAARRDLRLPRSQRGREDDHAADAGHADPPGRRRRHDRRGGPAARPGAGAQAHRLRGAGQRHLRPSPPPGVDLVHQARMYGVSKSAAKGLADDGHRGLPARRLRRPQDQHLLRRAAPAPRCRARRHPFAPGHLPGRADRRAGPAEPGPHVAGGAQAPRQGHDDLPHHPLPGRGRRALRPDLDHRCRADRRRGHPVGSQARDLRRRHHRGPGHAGHRRRAGARRHARRHRRSSPNSRTCTPARPSTTRCGSMWTAPRPPSRRSCAR